MRFDHRTSKAKRHEKNARSQKKQELCKRLTRRSVPNLGANANPAPQAGTNIHSEFERRFRVLTENTEDLICETDAGGKFLYVSPNYRKVLGYKPEELVGRCLKEFAHPEDTVELKRLLKGAEDTFEKRHVTMRLLNSQGEWVWFESAGALFCAESGEARIIAVSRDITKRRLVDEELAKARNLESLSVLAGGIAHDFNNILTAILVNISTARMDIPPDDECNTLLREAQNACMHARDLTRQLLTFSRGQALVKKTASIASVIRETVQFALRGSNVKCQFKLSDSLWPVEIDESQMSQVINNIVINADQAMPNGGHLIVSAKNVSGESISSILGDGENYVKVELTDDGEGIPNNKIGQIFDPYFTTKPEGSGLGLAMSYSIVQNHGGHLAVDSKEGRGTSVFLYLPAQRHLTQAAEEDTVPVVRAPKHARARVLVMDDEGIIRSSVKMMLKRLGHSVELAEDGDSALAQFREAMLRDRKFDIVIMDLTVPGGKGGLSTIKEMRRLDPDVKAIVASGHHEAPALTDFEAHGFSGVLMKPFLLKDVSAMIERLVLSKRSAL